MGQAVLLLILFGAAGLLSATQAWAIAARPASRVRYVGAWLVSTTGLAMLVLLVFGAGDQKLPRDIVRTTMVLAAITAAIAPWAGHRVAAPAGLRAAFVAIAKAPAGRINEWAKQRGWSQIALVSGADSPYQADYKCQGDSDDMQWPVMHVFRKVDGRIRHFWGTEAMMNHVDTVWPYWNLMDFTPEGRPDLPTPPQQFRSRFLEEHYLKQE
jgi:hypothetical protein